MKKFVQRSVLGLTVIFLAVIGATLSLSKLERSNSGVHTRLLVPLLGLASAKVAIHSGTGDSTVIKGLLDGPVVKIGADQSWSATWFCEQRAHRKILKGPALTIECAGKSSSFALAAPLPAAPGVTPMPEKLLILSDIEGNIAYLDGALRKLAVVDAGGAWAFGANRLVIAGDSVDRGRDVFAVLWRLHSLSMQATAVGGRLDVLIGNHEQYILRGNISRAHPEHVYALEQMGGVASAFASDTVLGAWLRQQPVIVKVGDVLVTHGGVSPTVAKLGLTVDQLNAASATYWRHGTAAKAALDAVFGIDGVTQYRGYFMALPDTYPKATDADVDHVLQAFAVKTIVVGHTIVEKITGLYGDRVYAVDVNSNTAEPQALMFVHGTPTVLDTGTPRALPDEKQAATLRRLDLFSGADWRTLARLVRRSYQLSQLPHPY